MDSKLFKSADQKRFNFALYGSAPLNPFSGNAALDFVSELYGVHIRRYFDFIFFHIKSYINRL